MKTKVKPKLWITILTRTLISMMNSPLILSLRTRTIASMSDKQNSGNETCCCKEFYGQPCSTVFDFDSIIDYRESCQEMSREELDLVIKSQLFAHRRTGLHTEAKKHKVKERERPYQEFYFQGKRVCRTTFCFLHNIERKKVLAISKSLDVDGLGPRVHGRVGKAPAHSLTFSNRERVKTFLCQYC